MKNISKWLLAGSVLAVAFACQSNQDNQNRRSNQDNQNRGQDNQNRGGCGQPPVRCEKPRCEPRCAPPAPKREPCPKPVCEPKKCCGAAGEAPAEKSANPEAEKIAAPISVPAIKVAEEKIAAPIAIESKERTSETAGSSAPTALTPAPEAKGSVTNSAPVKSAAKDQSAATSQSK